MTTLEQFKRTCHKYLIFDDDTFIDIIFAVILANRLNSKPVCLYLVGPPSSGKTAILQTLSDSDEIYAISKLTPHTIISGKIRSPKEKDPSLILKWDGKVVIIKDFTAMLSMRHEIFLEIIGILRDATDGTCRNAYGTGMDTLYKSKFGIIAACTNAIDRHRGLLAELGERFLTYRTPDITKQEATKRCQKASRNLTVSSTEEILCKAALNVLKIQRLKPPTLSDHYRSVLIKIASFVATARCHVQRDRKTKEQEIAVPEVPVRLSKQLCDLAVGLAQVREKRLVTKAEVKLVQKVAIDSLSLKRLRLIKAMLAKHPDYVPTKYLAGKLRFSVSVVQDWLEDLYILEIVDRRITDKGGRSPYTWKLTDGTMLKQILEYL